MQKIIYIGGIGHSGSTILSIMLGEVAKVFTLGEFGNFNELDRNCSCGNDLKTCPVWNRVISNLNQAELKTLQDKGPLIDKEKNILRFIFSSQFGKEYCSIYDKIFKVLFQTTDAEVLVDSSKNLSRAIALLNHSQYQIYFIHLIRDPRGYINSINKKRIKNKFAGLMSKWTIKNFAASKVVKSIAGDRYLRVTYEDLLLQPEKTINQISQLTDYDFSRISSYIKKDKPFSKKHIFSGNRISNKESIRFNSKYVKSNQIQGISNHKFWKYGGRIASLFGYDKGQSYLSKLKTSQEESNNEL